MGAGISGPLVMPAWCDPQSRHFRPLGWFDTLVGLLMVDDERFVFATPSGVEFNALRSEARLKWRRGNGFGTIPKFDLSIPQGSFRLYLSRPGQGAPQCGRRIAPISVVSATTLSRFSGSSVPSPTSGSNGGDATPPGHCAP